LVGDEAAEQQQHSETNQDKVDDPEAPIRAIVVLSNRHEAGSQLRTKLSRLFP
jgi:hypothetical protein